MSISIVRDRSLDPSMVTLYSGMLISTSEKLAWRTPSLLVNFNYRSMSLLATDTLPVPSSLVHSNSGSDQTL